MLITISQSPKLSLQTAAFVQKLKKPVQHPRSSFTLMNDKEKQ